MRGTASAERDDASAAVDMNAASQPDEIPFRTVRTGDRTGRRGGADRARHRHRRSGDRAAGRVGPSARRDLHDRCGCLHAHHRRAELPQLHDPVAVHADRNGGMGVGVARLPHFRRHLGLACRAVHRRCRCGRRFPAGGALHLPLSENEARRCDRARHPAGLLARLPADLRKPDPHSARLRVPALCDPVQGRHPDRRPRDRRGAARELRAGRCRGRRAELHPETHQGWPRAAHHRGKSRYCVLARRRTWAEWCRWCSS